MRFVALNIKKFWILKNKIWQILVVFSPIWLFSVYFPLFWRESSWECTLVHRFRTPLYPTSALVCTYFYRMFPNLLNKKIIDYQVEIELEFWIQILVVFRPIWLFWIYFPFFCRESSRECTLVNCFRSPLHHTSTLVCTCIHTKNSCVW